MNEYEWWLASAPALERIIDPSLFPLTSRVGEAAGQAYEGAYDPEYAHSFGLERIIDGTSVLINKGGNILKS
ncbi:MAG: hypothetical protein WDZ91_01900 [Paenibacillaceae bacterium]